jgi:DNA-binding GntR family transcriptional regulator
MSLIDLVTPLKRQTLSANVYDQLRDLVMSGQMMPGEQISLRTAAEALGVSVMPVREAMQRLVAEQALELTPSRTLRVPRMTAAQFKEITTIRTNLEGLATELAASAPGGVALREITRWHDEFAAEMNAANPDGSKLVTLNKEFHFAVYAAADMPVLLQMIEALWLRIGPILNYDLRAGSRRVGDKVAMSHHAALLAALKRRDGVKARAALQGDIESAADFILSAGVLVSDGALPPEKSGPPAKKPRAASTGTAR